MRDVMNKCEIPTLSTEIQGKTQQHGGAYIGSSSWFLWKSIQKQRCKKPLVRDGDNFQQWAEFKTPVSSYASLSCVPVSLFHGWLKVERSVSLTKGSTWDKLCWKMASFTMVRRSKVLYFFLSLNFPYPLTAMLLYFLLTFWCFCSSPCQLFIVFNFHSSSVFCLVLLPLLNTDSHLYLLYWKCSLHFLPFLNLS